MIAPASAAAAKGAGGGFGMTTGAKFAGVCIFGGAFGLIWAALAKGQAYKNDKIELTRQEAFTIAGTCGLGAGFVGLNWPR